MSKGIVIVITGHPYYGRYAYNLAVSIKATEDFPIALLYAPKALTHLSTQQLEVFDEFIELPKEVPANVSCKLYAGQFSPYVETLLLDADMVWLPIHTPSELFKSCEGSVFTGITEGHEQDPAKNYFFWADVEEIKKVYTLKANLYQWRTEVVYFNRDGREVLKRALEIVQNPRLSTVKQFGYAVPDELGVNIAAAECGVVPHIYKWQPSYWHLMYNNHIPAPCELHEKYYLLSFGSNVASGTLKKVHDNLMKAYCYKLGRQHVFDLPSKRDFLKERDKI
jgi:hypothetical protein